MASATASRSSMGRRAQTCGLATSRMVAPPCHAYSLEGRNQLFNGNGREDGRFGAGFRRQIRAADGDESDPARQDFNLAVTDMSRQSSESRELQYPAVEGMTRIGDSDLALAFFRDQRGITLGEVAFDQMYVAACERVARILRCDLPAKPGLIVERDRESPAIGVIVFP